VLLIEALTLLRRWESTVERKAPIVTFELCPTAKRRLGGTQAATAGAQ
jgi:hypothetical protein